MKKYLGPIPLARWEFLICILIRCYAIIIRLVIVLAIAEVSDSHAFHDEFYIVCNQKTKS